MGVMGGMQKRYTHAHKDENPKTRCGSYASSKVKLKVWVSFLLHYTTSIRSRQVRHDLYGINDGVFFNIILKLR